MRRIIQIAGNQSCLYALCDDGTTWDMQDCEDGWRKMPRIPQHHVPDGEYANEYELEKEGESSGAGPVFQEGSHIDAAGNVFR